MAWDRASCSGAADGGSQGSLCPVVWLQTLQHQYIAACYRQAKHPFVIITLFCVPGFGFHRALSQGSAVHSQAGHMQRLSRPKDKITAAARL
jgi:hypothetical protein